MAGTSTPTGRLPTYRRIATSLRNDILEGKYPPGSLLPSTEEFAATLSSSYFTVHSALKTLVKEGWIERLHGHGTYVAQPEKRFLHAGIFHSLDIFSNEEATFPRCLNDCLVRNLRALGKTTHLIIDSRPETEQTEMFPPLADAIFQRQIHCLIAPGVNSKSLPLVLDLPFPVAVMSDQPRLSGVKFDEAGFLRGAVKSLQDQGCRTIGFITSVPPIDGDFGGFMREIKNAGLESRPEWMLQPPEYQHRLIDYGFRAFRQIWKQDERPEGVIVYPDTAARGAITAILQAGVRVPEQMKFVFHRNAHTGILCPFPVTWALTDENAAATGLIASIQRQFAGEPPAGLLVPYAFEFDDGSRWMA